MKPVDVAVIGAGAIGLASSIELAARGLSVAVVESGLPGGASSTRTGGGVRAQFASELNVRLSLASAAAWRDFEARFGVDPMLRRIGYLFLSRSPQQADAFASQVAMQRRLGVASEALDAREIAARWPSLAACGFRGASFCASDGWLNQHRVVDGYTRGALVAGVAIHGGTDALGLIEVGDRIVGVSTTGGRLDAGTVVVATGASPGAWLGPHAARLPVTARRHELLLVESDRADQASLPWLIDVDEQVHLRPDVDGRLLLGGFLGRDDAVDADRFDTRADASWSSRVRAQARRSFGPAGATGSIVRGWAGLYPSTPDHHPIIDCLSPGLCVAMGFYRTGLMHAPAAGRLVAELVVDGGISSLPAEGLSVARFAAADARAVERTGF